VIASFGNKGLEELYLTGKTRRIGADYVRKCVRILITFGWSGKNARDVDFEDYH
jgi:plasmid maintenance system killer protein